MVLRRYNADLSVRHADHRFGRGYRYVQINQHLCELHPWVVADVGEGRRSKNELTGPTHQA